MRETERIGGLIHHRAYGPRENPLRVMARLVTRRRDIEEGLERAKGAVGLGQYEVRRWEAWHRHVTLGLVAHATLQVVRARSESKRGHQ